MKYTGKKLNNQVDGKDVYAVCFRSKGKGKYLIDTVCDTLLQAQQEALVNNIQHFEYQKREAWEKLKSIALKTNQFGEGVYLEQNKNEDGTYSYTIELGDLLC